MAAPSGSLGSVMLRCVLAGLVCLLAALLIALVVWFPPQSGHAEGEAPSTIGPAASDVAVSKASNLVAAAAAGAPTLTLAELLAGHSKDWRVARLQENPAVLVIEFPSLTAQGAAMNRLAALLEKADAPRDRVLSDAELAALIARAGDNAQTFFQGHDYDAAGLARFDALVVKQGQPLNAAEQRLRRVLLDSGLLRETPEGVRPQGAQAVITFTATQPDDPTTTLDESVDERRRESVLRHEVSHGRFFTRPAYREHCRHFWRDVLTESQRESMRRYLASLGYDRRDEELMLNEAQALLLHTPDTRAFNAEAAGIPEPMLSALRTRFWRTLPAEVDAATAGADGLSSLDRPLPRR
jgi:hypothetical protein